MSELKFLGDYSYNKAIRFKLEHKCGELPKFESNNSNPLDLIDLGLKIVDDFKDLIYLKTEKNELKLDKNKSPILTKFVSIKKQWLRDYTKLEFYDGSKNKSVDFSITNFPYLSDSFKKWIVDWTDAINHLNNLLQDKENLMIRRSEIAYYLLLISSKNYFNYIKDFSFYSNDKNTTKVAEFQKLILIFEEKLNSCVIKYAPAQNAGLLIASGSMNYYAINKKPKDYDFELSQLKKEYEIKQEEYNLFKVYKSTQKSLLFQYINSGLDKDEILKKLADNYNFYKENNKKIKTFYSGDSGNDLAYKYSRLFADDRALTSIINLTDKINELNLKLQTTNNNKDQIKLEISALKQKRGFYFIKRHPRKSGDPDFYISNEKNWHDRYTFCFSNYTNFCKIFKVIAQKTGKLKAKIRAIEKEKIESQTLKYWSFVVDRSDEKELWMVPKENRTKFKDLLKSDNSTDVNIYQLTSLTMRALNKLCFAEESSFVKDMPDYLKDLQKKVKEATDDEQKIKNQRKKINFSTDIKTKSELKLSFFKELIKSEYAKSLLDLSKFNLEDLQKVKDLKEFEMLLEKNCYVLEKIGLSKESCEKLIKECNILIFKITSYDLEDRPKNTYQTKESDYKRITSEIWNTFWENPGINLRINPEVKIRYREKNEEHIKYLEEKGFDLTKIKNRFIVDQYTCYFTFTLNPGKLYPELVFAKTEELIKKIQEFNDQFNKTNLEGTYKYGIDRGSIELSTLCLAKFDKNDVYTYTVDDKTKTILKPKFPNGEEDIKVYELKKELYNKKAISDLENLPMEKRKPKRIIANISYFIDKINDPNWFNKKTVTCIDLTTAKVIKDKIIVNGDLLTFLKMKKEAAKRVLFELVSEGKITPDHKELKWGSENLEDPSSRELRYYPYTSDKIVYHFENNFGRDLEGLLIKDDLIYSKENVLSNFQVYLNELLDNKLADKNEPNTHTPTIPKINNLRRALVSNMVGVITYLQKYYPGYVVLENLKSSEELNKFERNYINTSIPFEKALIQKFQTMGLVPPHIKNLWEIREEKTKKNLLVNKQNFQLGAILFVNKDRTSKDCPYCEKPYTWDKEKADELKFKLHQYKCGPDPSCGFDTKELLPKFDFLKEISDPDKIAAFNVAKRWKDIVENDAKK